MVHANVSVSSNNGEAPAVESPFVQPKTFLRQTEPRTMELRPKESRPLTALDRDQMYGLVCHIPKQSDKRLFLTRYVRKPFAIS
jgi:hypothetical protein